MKHKPAKPTHFPTQLAQWQNQRRRPDLLAPRLQAEPRQLGPETPIQNPEVAGLLAEQFVQPDPTADYLYLADQVTTSGWPEAEADLVLPEAPPAEAELHNSQALDPAPPLLLPEPAPLLSEYEEVLFAKIKAQHEQAEAQPPVDELAELEQSVDELVRQVRAEFFGQRID
jgi:hypothetical protein